MTMNSDELIDLARTSAGLEDLGADTYREGLDVLVASYEKDADLNDMGRAMAQGTIVSTLVNRLQIEDWYRRYPEIDDQQIVAPLFVLGLPRTGSTALGALLSEDPAVRVARMWEAGNPCPPPETATELTDPRIAVARQRIEGQDSVLPALKSMVPLSATAPSECLTLLAYDFRSSNFEAMAKIPSYSEWLIDCDIEPAYRYHQRVLKLLQWRCPPTNWRLRTPAHLYAIEALDRVYPDARFVMTHRDVASVIPSVADLQFTLSKMFTDHPDPEYFGTHCAERWETALHRGIAFRDAGREARFYDIGFRDMQADPIASIRGLYEWLGEEYTAAAEANMVKWRADNPRGAHGAHTYTPEDFGLSADGLHAQFQFYNDRFDVPLDVR
jgi:hypothetical protein